MEVSLKSLKLKIKLFFYTGTEMTAASHLMAPSDLNYGECGTPLLTFKHYLKDWAEGGYYTTDKPNPRGEIGNCFL